MSTESIPREHLTGQFFLSFFEILLNFYFFISNLWNWKCSVLDLLHIKFSFVLRGLGYAYVGVHYIWIWMANCSNTLDCRLQFSNSIQIISNSNFDLQSQIYKYVIGGTAFGSEWQIAPILLIADIFFKFDLFSNLSSILITILMYKVKFLLTYVKIQLNHAMNGIFCTSWIFYP